MDFSQHLDELQERLRRVGLTDVESLRRALQDDPQLAADLQAFFQSNPEAPVLPALFMGFLEVQSYEQMVNFWLWVPEELEKPLVALVERLIAEASPDSPAETLEGLRARLHTFRQIREAALPGVFSFEEKSGGEGKFSISPRLVAQWRLALERIKRYQRSDDLSALNVAIAAWGRLLNHPNFAATDVRFRLAVWNNTAVAMI